MKIAFLDVAPKRPFRVTKDSNGGFGTTNDYGDALAPRLLAWLVARLLDWPPPYVAQTAALLKRQGHVVFYTRDATQALSADLALVTSSIVAHETELSAIRHVARAGVPVLALGPFATSVHAPYVEAGAKVVEGEPEGFFLNAPPQDAMALAELPSLIKAPLVDDLDSLPLPDWEMVFATLPPRMSFLGKGATLPIMASRGCPYSCFHYCTYPLQQGRKLRLRSPEAIVAEMCHWQDKLGVSSFIFRDPVFGIDKAHTQAFAEHLLGTGRRFAYGIETHLRNLDEEMALSLKASGLSLVYTGVESVTPEVIKDAKRQTVALDEQRKRIAFLENNGIAVKTMFMFGFPNDTLETCRANIDEAIRLCASYAQFSVFTPYPGTPVFEQLKNDITARRYEDFTQWHLVFRHGNLTSAQIRKLLDEAYTRFYTNPRWLFKLLKRKLAGA